MRLTIACLLLDVILLASGAGAQPPSAPSARPAGARAVEEMTAFLAGTWEGEGDGTPGRSTGGFSFETALDGAVVLRRSRAVSPATADKAAVSHQDLMVLYAEGGQVRADSFDNEGHVIHYSVAFDHLTDTLTFVSPIVEGQPRYRLVYRPLAIDRVLTTFEIAPPGRPGAFEVSVKGTSKKVK